jgi:hypothetical protein
LIINRYFLTILSGGGQEEPFGHLDTEPNIYET